MMISLTFSLFAVIYYFRRSLREPVGEVQPVSGPLVPYFWYS